MENKSNVFRFVMEHAKPYAKENFFKKRFPEHYCEVLKCGFPNDFKFQQKLYHYLMDDFDLKLGICPVCGKRCKFKYFNVGYNNHCCAKCVKKDNVVKEKTKQTNIKKFGVENPFQSKEIKEQIKETLLERYGGDHPMHCKDIVDKLQKTNIERYGNICSLHGEEVARKVEETNMERYGVKNGGGSKEAIEKIKQTTMNKYGCEFYVQSQDYKDKYYV